MLTQNCLAQVDHTAEAISSACKEALAQFGVGEYNPEQGIDTVGREAFGVVIDEGSNMVKAFQDFEGGPCVDHRLSNALKDALNDSDVAHIVKKVKLFLVLQSLFSVCMLITPHVFILICVACHCR